MPSAAELRALGQYVGGPQPGRGRQLMELLGQTWPARAVRDTANAVGGYVQHVGDAVAGRVDPMAVEPAMDFSLAIGGPSLAMAPLKQGPGTFGGMKSHIGPKTSALNEAKGMEKAGGYADEILEKTGWFKDVDGHWKHEIDDSTGKLSPFALGSLNLGVQKKLGEIYEGPVLEAYPHLKDVRITNNVPEGAWGVYRGNEIGLAPGRSLQDTESTLLHEIQHGIQQREGFAKGGSVEEFVGDPAVIANTKRQMEELKDARGALLTLEDMDARKAWLRQRGHEPGSDAWEYAMGLRREDVGKIDEGILRLQQALKAAEDPEGSYRRLAGEVESRNVQHRRTMNAQDRVESPPWYTRDVQEDFLVRGQTDPDPMKGWLFRRSVPLGPRT
jgi:hypothetical protein